MSDFAASFTSLPGSPCGAFWDFINAEECDLDSTGILSDAAAEACLHQLPIIEDRLGSPTWPISGDKDAAPSSPMTRKGITGNDSFSSLLSECKTATNEKRARSSRLPEVNVGKHCDLHDSPSPTLMSAASTQLLERSADHPIPAAQRSDSQCTNEDDLDAVSKPPQNSNEKQRSRDKINSLLDKLALVVPPTGNSGARRPKHVLLADAIRTIRELQEQVRNQGRVSGPLSPRGSTAPTTPTAQGVTISPACSAPLDMPVPLDISSASTGVMLDAPKGVLKWRLRVTCRDRPGLLGDVALALRALPLTITAASVATTSEGKAQQVYDVSVLDKTLAPEEVQCAVNAALYAHLVTPATGAGNGNAPATPAKPVPPPTFPHNVSSSPELNKRPRFI